MGFTGDVAYYIPKQEALLCMSNMKITVSEEAKRYLHRTGDK